MPLDGYIWPPLPPPNGQKDLTELFPRIVGGLTACHHRPVHIILQRLSAKRYQRVLASFQVKYLDDAKVWIFCTWSTKRGQLLKLGKERRSQMEWQITCSYEKFERKVGFLKKLCGVIGKARIMPPPE